MSLTLVGLGNDSVIGSREVGPTAAVIGFVGYPDDVKRQVPLAR